MLPEWDSVCGRVNVSRSRQFSLLLFQRAAKAPLMSCSILQWFCCTTPPLVSPFTMISSLFGPSRERASILTPPRVETLNLLVREYRRKLVSIYGVLHRSARWKNKLPLKLGLWSLQNIFQRSWSWRWWCSTQCGERATICNCPWCVKKKKKKKKLPPAQEP